MNFAAEEEKYDSSYFIPNYPIKEPVFYIPRVPSITKVPEPKRPSRPPPPGYDMRTLRKQLEHLNEEFEEREHTQGLLYTQNEQLWAYIQELLEANKANAQLMRGEVVKLHVELKNAHRERFNIAEKLQLARNSKQMLVELNHELHGAQLTVEEIEIRKREAEAALMQAREENAHLEEALRSQEEMLHGVNNELDEFRKRRLEEQALDLADDFFYTNKTVLRAAYYRFRAGVQKRFKLSRIHGAVQSVYSWHLKVTYFRSWCGFIGRKHIMHANQAHRRHEQLTLCMQQWKLYTVLEKLFTKSRRRQLMSKIFKAWRSDARESAYDKWALTATQQLHTLQFKRKMFVAWKKHTMFLQWNNPMVLLWEQEACAHFMRVVMRAWARVCKASKHTLSLQAAQVPGVIQWWHLTRWRELCESRWRRRGKLLRRFFRNMHRMVAERDESGVTRKYACAFWVAYRQRRALKHWIHYLRTRRMFISAPWRNSPASAADATQNGGISATTSASRSMNGLYIDTMRSESTIGSPTMLAAHFGTPAANSTATHNQLQSGIRDRSLSYSTSATNTVLSGANRKISNHRRGRPYNRWQQSKTLQVLSHMKKRWLRSSMLVLIYATSVLRRQGLCLQAAMRHYISSKASRALHSWHNNVRREVRKRQKKRKYMLQLIMQSWKAFTKETKAATKLQQGLNALQERVRQNHQATLLRRWYDAVATKKRLNHCSKYLVWHKQKHTLRRCFTNWRGQWSKALYWQVKELEIEFSRAKSLNDLNQLALRDLESAHAQSRNETAELEASLMVLQESLADSNNQCKQQEALIATREFEKTEAMAALEALQTELRDVLAQQEQMKAFENLLVNELQQQEAERVKLRHAAAEVVARVSSETDALREEVGAAREHAMYAERLAEEKVLRAQQEVTDVQREADEVQRIVLQKRGRLSLLEQEHAGVMDGLSRVQYKLGEVTRDGAALIAENEALIRSKGSAVRVLRSNAGLSEARVNALQDMATEFESQRGRMKLSEVLQEDSSELNELLALQRQIESGSFRAPVLSHSAGSAGSSGSPTAKGVSLYRNSLSAGPQPSPTAAVLRGSGSRKEPSARPTASVPSAGAGAVGSVSDSAARSGAPKRSIRTPHGERSPSLAVRSVSIAAPTPPILTPHNQSYDQLLQQTHPYSAVRSTQVAPDVSAHAHSGMLGTSRGAPASHYPTAMEASIFELMHHQGSEGPYHRSEDRFHASSSSSAVPVTSVPPPPRAYSPSNKKVNNYTGSESRDADDVFARPSTSGTFNLEAYGGSYGQQSSGHRPQLHVSPPLSPKSLARVQPAPRSPPTFLTAGRESDSDGEAAPQHQHQQAPSHLRGGSVRHSHDSRDAARRSVEIDILSKYEQTRRELHDAFHPTDHALSLGSSPDSHGNQVSSEGDSERSPNDAQVGDYYYYEHGVEGAEDDGSSFDADNYEGDAVDEAEFVVDSASDGSNSTPPSPHYSARVIR